MNKISLKKPHKYVTFLLVPNVDANGYVNSNLLNTELSYVSKYYTPELKVSYLGSKVMQQLAAQDPYQNYTDLDENTVVAQAYSTDLQYEAPKLFLMLRVICLEVFALAYAVNGDTDTDYLQYATMDDTNLLMQNIEYTKDAISSLQDESSTKYDTLISLLDDINISVGYMKAAINAYNSTDGLGVYSSD